jgi:hypothetical protein
VSNSERSCESGIAEVRRELEPEDKPALDNAEGIGTGYLEETVNVLTDAGLVTAATYCANDKDANAAPWGDQATKRR